MVASTFTGAAGNLDWNGVLRVKNPDGSLGAIIHTNWSGGGNDDYIPTASDDLNIGFNGNFAVFIAGNDVNGNQDAADSLTISAGSSLAISANLSLGSGSTNSGVALSNSGAITFTQGVLAIGGDITNAGSITLQDGQNYHTYISLTGDATLSGGGTISLDSTGGDYNYNEITGSSGAPVTLHNAGNTISGAGTIGKGGTYQDPNYQLILDNQAGGTIDANNSGFQLTLNPESISNAGTIEDTDLGGLLISKTSITQTTDGQIVATGTGSVVTLSDVSVYGGKLNTTAGGLIKIGSGTNRLDGSLAGLPVTNIGTTELAGTQVTLDGSIVNNGTFKLADGQSYVTYIAIGADDVTLTGTGTISLVSNTGDFNYNEITGFSTTTATTLHNASTIAGAGTIGKGGTYQDKNYLLNLDNQAGGLINANNAAFALTLDAESVSNAGTLEDTGQGGQSGGLLISNTTVTQTGAGVITAIGTGSHVNLTAATIEGGLISTSDGGEFRTVGTASVLDGSTAGSITNDGKVVIEGGTALTLKGSIVNNGTNNGTFELDDGQSYATSIYVDASGATLTGSGKITLNSYSGDFNYNEITGVSTTTATTLHNVDNTISGAGTIGKGGTYQDANYKLILDNQAGGLINANNAGFSLTLDAESISNAGTLEDTGQGGKSGGLLISNTTVTQTGAGVITAIGTGSHVDLTAATIEGGLISTSNGGEFRTVGSASVLDGSTAGSLTNDGKVVVGGSTALKLKGSIVNNGTFELDNGQSYATSIYVDASGATLTGSGKITLNSYSGDFNFNEITGVSTTAATTLHNASTIEGGGTIGKGGTYQDPNYLLILDNQAGGTIDADNSAFSLTINTGATITNNGILEANGGKLVVDDAVAGSGSALVTGGGTITFKANDQQNLTFQGSGTVALEEATNPYQGTISGFAHGDTIDLEGVAFDSTGGTQYLSDSHQLQITEGGTTYTLKLDPSEDFSGESFQLTDDGSGGTQITVSLPTIIYVSSGVTSTGIVLSSGREVVVLSGGVTSGTTLSSGSSEEVRSGGVASGTIVSNGGLETALSGGIASGSKIGNGGSASIFGSATDTSVDVGGVGTVQSGGVERVVTHASGVTVSAGGSEIIQGGGSATGTLVSGGYEFVQNGGSALSTVVFSRGEERVSGGAVASGTSIGSGGSQIVLSGGIASGTSISSGGSETVLSGGIASGSRIGNGGSASIFGSAVDTSVDAGGVGTVQSGGVERVANHARRVTVNAGGSEIIQGGGTATGTLVSGGYEFVQNGGSALATVVFSRGEERVSGGGVASGTVVSSGGSQIVLSGGIASGSRIGSGGSGSIFGSAVDTSVDAGGVGAVESGGTERVVNNASGLTVSAGGSEIIQGGATATGTLVSGGYEFVQNGGSALATVVFSRGEERVSGGGVASGTVVSSGGSQMVLSGGIASGSRIGSGGSGSIFGSAIDTSVDAGGVGSVESGGTERVVNNASGLTVDAGGSEIIQGGGTATGTLVSGGYDFVENGGSALATIVFSRGEERVSGGALASGTVVSSGGFQTVLSGGIASGTVISGGLVEVVSGGSATAVSFAGSGTLLLDDSVHFSGTVGGFTTPSDHLDLADVSFANSPTLSWTQQTGSGTLKVTDGTHTANITLLGTHNQADFNTASDTAGGTLVTDPPLLSADGTMPVDVQSMASAGLAAAVIIDSVNGAGGSSVTPGSYAVANFAMNFPDISSGSTGGATFTSATDGAAAAGFIPYLPRQSVDPLLFTSMTSPA